MAITTQPQPTFLVDTEAERDPTWPEGSIIHCKDSLKTYIVHNGSFCISGSPSGSTLTTGTINPAILGSGTPSSSNYLRGDSSWQTVSGSGDVVGPTSSTDGSIVLYDGTSGKLLKSGTLITSGTMSASGAIIGGSGTFSNTVTAGTFSATGALIGGTLLTIGTVSATGNLVGVGAVITGASTIGSLLITDGSNISVGTVTGTIIGTTTNQKLSIYGATPIVQPANTIAIDTVLNTFGLRATGGSALFGLLVSGNSASFSATVTIGTASISGNLITGGTASVTGAIIGGTTITVGTVSATGNIISGATVSGASGIITTLFTVGTVSATGGIIGSASLTIGTGTIIAAKITATTGSFTALLTAGTASISGAIIGGTTLTAGTGSFSGNFFTTGTVSVGGAIIGGTTITIGTVSATGQLISAHTSGVVGQLAALIYTFGTASALQTMSMPTPFAGSIDNVYVTTGSVSAVVASYTVRVGSAGSVAVATVANTTASRGVQQALTITVTTYAITNGLVVTRSAQGTAGDTSICIVVRKTA